MIEDEVRETARAINRQMRELADMRKRRTLNVYVTDDGRIAEIESSIDLKAKEDDEQRILTDMLRYLDMKLKERDGITDRVSEAISCEAEGRNREHSDAHTPEPEVSHEDGGERCVEETGRCTEEETVRAEKRGCSSHGMEGVKAGEK